MPRSAKELFEAKLSDKTLRILLYGPNPQRKHDDPRLTAIANKRAQIRAELENQGHHVDYGEDVVDLSLPPPFANIVLQERLLEDEYDHIILLVSSTGTIVEAATISQDETRARKTHFLVADDENHGVLEHVVKWAENAHRARSTVFSYPSDIESCRVKTQACEVVTLIQLARLYPAPN